MDLRQQIRRVPPRSHNGALDVASLVNVCEELWVLARSSVVIGRVQLVDLGLDTAADAGNAVSRRIGRDNGDSQAGLVVEDDGDDGLPSRSNF